MTDINSTKDLMISASGRDDYGMPKASIGITHERWGINGDVTTVVEDSYNNPVVNIFKHAGYVQVDLDFGSKFDVNLKLCWNILENFCEAANSVDDEATEIPTIVLTIIPNEFEGKYYMLGVNPIFHTLQPKNPSGEPTVIRLVFNEEDFMFYEAE
jgi:hypothetical protein